MFWTVVFGVVIGLIVFFYVLPVVVPVSLIVLTSKATWQVIGAVVLLALIAFFLVYANSESSSNRSTGIETNVLFPIQDEENKKNFIDGLRVSNSGKNGYFVVGYNATSKYFTSSGFRIYPQFVDCITERQRVQDIDKNPSNVYSCERI